MITHYHFFLKNIFFSFFRLTNRHCLFLSQGWSVYTALITCGSIFFVCQQLTHLPLIALSDSRGQVTKMLHRSRAFSTALSKTFILFTRNTFPHFPHTVSVNLKSEKSVKHHCTGFVRS